MVTFMGTPWRVIKLNLCPRSGCMDEVAHDLLRYILLALIERFKTFYMHGASSAENTLGTYRD